MAAGRPPLTQERAGSEACLNALDRMALAKHLEAEAGTCFGLACLTWRRAGRVAARRWLRDISPTDLLANLDAHTAETLEVAVFDRQWRVPHEAWHAVFSDAQRGRLGLSISCGDRCRRVTPAEMIATNRSFARCLEAALEDWGLDEAAFLAAGGHLVALSGPQLLIDPQAPRGFLELYRGHALRLLSGDAKREVEGLLQGCVAWLLSQQQESGALTYKYWPSNGRRSKANNTIRQFMASLALTDVAAFRDDPEILRAATASLEANLKAYLKQEGEIAVIEFEGKAKLGAAALAALCLLRHPDAAAFAGIRDRLEAGILALWQEDGLFRSFHRPAERNDNQNFYPGEALTYLAERVALQPDGALRQRILGSLRAYRRFHREAPNPAFVPWHSLAIRALSLNPLELPRDLIRHFFAMNDWLIDLQQWESAPHRDMAGRFYDPEQPDFGPPHASSTAIYLEGLAAAFDSARALGETARADRYARTIWRGLRHLCQLQFRAPWEGFYLSYPERVMGGLRSRVWDNTLRIDNAQHTIAASLAILRQPALLAAKPAPEDLVPPEPASAAGLASQ